MLFSKHMRFTSVLRNRLHVLWKLWVSFFVSGVSYGTITATEKIWRSIFCQTVGRKFYGGFVVNHSLLGSRIRVVLVYFKHSSWRIELLWTEIDVEVLSSDAKCTGEHTLQLQATQKGGSAVKTRSNFSFSTGLWNKICSTLRAKYAPRWWKLCINV